MNRSGQVALGEQQAPFHNALVRISYLLNGEDHRATVAGERPPGDRPAGDRPAGDRPAGDRPTLGSATEDNVPSGVLLGELSDDTVVSVLEELAQLTSSDSTFAMLCNDHDLLTHEWSWTTPGGSFEPPRIGTHLGDFVGPAVEFLKLGHTVPVDNIAEVDLDLEPATRQHIERNRVSAVMIVPVVAAGSLVGIAGVQMFDQPRSWEHDTVHQVEVVASIMFERFSRAHERAALVQANARALAISRFTPSPLVILDAAGAITWTSESLSRVNGFSEAEVLGRRLEELLIVSDESHDDGFVADDDWLLAPFEARLSHRDGSWHWVEVCCRGLEPTPGSRDRVVVELRDVHERRVQLDELRHDVDHDSLTGLLSRSGLARQLDALAEDKRAIVVVYCDLNRFKAWNDTYGHKAGDELLAGVATALESVVRPGDLAARVGGDEFVVVGVEPSSSALECFRSRLESAVAQLPMHPGRPSVTMAVGISVVGPASDADRLCAEADADMYRRKAHRHEFAVTNSNPLHR